MESGTGQTKLLYKDRIIELLKKVHKTDIDFLFSEQEINEVILISVSALGGFEELERQINIGVENGYSVDKQFELMEKLFTEYKK